MYTYLNDCRRFSRTQQENSETHSDFGTLQKQQHVANELSPGKNILHGALYLGTSVPRPLTPVLGQNHPQLPFSWLVCHMR